MKIFFETTSAFFDNSSVSAILAVMLATFFARREYRKQKNQDRDSLVKTDLINDILLLQEKVSYTLLIIDRIANSWIITTKDTKTFLEESLATEVTKLSDSVNEDIPALLPKIGYKINIYFNNKIVTKRFVEFRDELKKWHDKITGFDFDLKKRIKDQPEILSDDLDEKTKLLIEAIWDEQTTYQIK